MSLVPLQARAGHGGRSRGGGAGPIATAGNFYRLVQVPGQPVFYQGAGLAVRSVGR